MSEEGRVSFLTIDPSDEALFKEYCAYKTEEVKEIHERFLRIRDQANKRIRVAMKVLTIRAHDNHKKPPSQTIVPTPLIVFPKGPGGR